MKNLVMVINEGHCEAFNMVSSKLTHVNVSELPKDLTETLNKYMVSNQLNFDLRDEQLDRSNLEQSKGSLKDKRSKMVAVAFSAISSLAVESSNFIILSSNRLVGEVKDAAAKIQPSAKVVTFVPSGANRDETDRSIVAKVNELLQ